MNPPVIVVRLPRLFYEDHKDRELPSGSPKKWLAREVDVELTKEEYDEVLDDARHYADPANGYAAEGYRGLVMSARATVKRLEQYGPHDFHRRTEEGVVQEKYHVRWNKDSPSLVSGQYGLPLEVTIRHNANAERRRLLKAARRMQEATKRLGAMEELAREHGVDLTE